MRSTTSLLALLLVATAWAAPAPDLIGTSDEPVLEKRVFDATNKAAVAEVIKNVRAANTAAERYNILGTDGMTFDFLTGNKAAGGGKDGSFVSANAETFPGTIGQDMSMLMIFLGPCGMVPPHIHQRATEYLVNIAGPPLLSIIVPEGGAPAFTTTVNPGQVAVFPKGSLHMAASTDCYPTLAVASLNHESPGALFFASAYQALDSESIGAAFGQAGATVYNSSAIPAPIAVGRQSCLDKCGIQRDTFDISTTSNVDLMKQAMAGWLRAESINPIAGTGPGSKPKSKRWLGIF